MTAKTLTPNLTSYDLLKTAALLLMIVDHVGYYFYEDEMWWRAVGRLSAPIWLFLIGYAKSRDFSARMWIGIAILTISNWVVGEAVLPLTILATMLVARAIIDPLMGMIARNWDALYPTAFVFLVLTVVTFMLFEYGAVAMLPVMFGYLARNRETFPMKTGELALFGFLALLGYFIVQIAMFFQFSDLQEVAVGAGLLAVWLVLLKFEPAEYTATAALPRPLTALCQLCGRHSLEFYVGHIVLFRLVAIFTGISGGTFFDFHILE